MEYTDTKIDNTLIIAEHVHLSRNHVLNALSWFGLIDPALLNDKDKDAFNALITLINFMTRHC